MQILKNRGVVGEVCGGGTLLDKDGEIKECDIDIFFEDESKENLDLLMDAVKRMPFFPKGSAIYCNEKKMVDFGGAEGLSLALNGADLPKEIYERCDINHVIEKLEESLKDAGHCRAGGRGRNTHFYIFMENPLKR